MEYITLKLKKFLNNAFCKKKKTNIILRNYIKNYINTHILIEVKWLVDF